MDRRDATAAVGGGAIWLAVIGLLNSGLASAYYLRLAFSCAQQPPEADGETPAQAAAPVRVGVAVSASVLFAAAATLALGIVPNEALRASDAGAQSLKPLTDASDASPVTAMGLINPRCWLQQRSLSDAIAPNKKH